MITVADRINATIVACTIDWYRARRPSNWHDVDNIGHRDQQMMLTFSADHRLLDAVELLIKQRDSLARVDKQHMGRQSLIH